MPNGPGEGGRGAGSTYLRVVGVLGGHRRGGLRGELIQLAGGDALVDSRGDFLCHEYLRSEKQDEEKKTSGADAVFGRSATRAEVISRGPGGSFSGGTREVDTA